MDWGRGRGEACILGAGTDTAGGWQELGWRAAIVRPGSGGRRGRGKADVEEVEGGGRFGLRRRSMGVLPSVLLPEPTVEAITAVQPSCRIPRG